MPSLKKYGLPKNTQCFMYHRDGKGHLMYPILLFKKIYIHSYNLTYIKQYSIRLLKISLFLKFI